MPFLVDSTLTSIFFDPFSSFQICNYIKQRSHEFQCIVISLKDMFFEHADCLVGVCKDVDTLSSKILTLNLNQFDAGEDALFEGLASPALSASTTTPMTGGKKGPPGSGGASGSLGKRKLDTRAAPRRTKLAAVGEGEDEEEGKAGLDFD